MKKIKIILAVLTVILLTVTCKKEHVPTTTISTPVFYFNGTIGGVSTSIDAGINNYYMYSSYMQDTNHVYNFIGNLQKTTSNLSSLQIQINDYKVSAINGSTQIDSSLLTKYYSYYTGGSVTTTTAYNVQFNSSYTASGGTAQTYNWNFGDGSTSTLANPTHTYTHLGYYDLCLNITGSSCSNNTCDTLNLSSSAAFACHSVITSTVNGANVTFSCIPTGVGPISSFKYLWNFGDTFNITYDTSTFQSPTHIYDTTSSQIHTVSLKVTDAIGNISRTKYNIAIAVPSFCTTNYSVASIQTVTTTSTNTLGLANVIVKWTDASGNVYTSDNPLQPASSNFQIISVDNYQNNTNNQTTKKLHIKFNCTVYNGSNSILITNADAIIAVAYK